VASYVIFNILQDVVNIMALNFDVSPPKFKINPLSFIVFPASLGITAVAFNEYLEVFMTSLAIFHVFPFGFSMNHTNFCFNPWIIKVFPLLSVMRHRLSI